MDAEMSLVWPCRSPACAHDIDADVKCFLDMLGMANQFKRCVVA